jgi:hypothetical protein
MRKIRISAFPPHHLTRTDESFSNSERITWSTGKRIQPDDIQVFAVMLPDEPRSDTANDPRVDAVHSIWRALTPVRAEYAEVEWPIQAKFEVLVKLDNPVPKAELVLSGLLKQRWPRNSSGKLLKTDGEIETLAQVLANNNPAQRLAIFNALGIPLAAARKTGGATFAVEDKGDESHDSDVVTEKCFIEGEKRASRTTVRRDPGLRAAAKKRWGLKCYCCSFDFEQFYGGEAKGLAIVHHLQPFTGANAKPRNSTVENVRVLCANCHQVIHIKNEPVEVDDLKTRLSKRWTPWTPAGVAPIT